MRLRQKNKPDSRGLDPDIQSQLERPCFFWMAASKGGHDDGIGGNIRVIESLKGKMPAALERTAPSYGRHLKPITIADVL